jgi:hypothetical protein
VIAGSTAGRRRSYASIAIYVVTQELPLWLLVLLHLESVNGVKSPLLPSVQLYGLLFEVEGLANHSPHEADGMQFHQMYNEEECHIGSSL